MRAPFPAGAWIFDAVATNSRTSSLMRHQLSIQVGSVRVSLSSEHKPLNRRIRDATEVPAIGGPLCQVPVYDGPGGRDVSIWRQSAMAGRSDGVRPARSAGGARRRIAGNGVGR